MEILYVYWKQFQKQLWILSLHVSSASLDLFDDRELKYSFQTYANTRYYRDTHLQRDS